MSAAAGRLVDVLVGEGHEVTVVDVSAAPSMWHESAARTPVRCLPGAGRRARMGACSAVGRGTTAP
ncbi:MAG: hypothetical protein M5U19_16390, partial [Microthrixaceae bacterium]|nr:hypothetical protein [Microthrixaceae bacterium]